MGRDSNGRKAKRPQSSLAAAQNDEVRIATTEQSYSAMHDPHLSHFRSCIFSSAKIEAMINACNMSTVISSDSQFIYRCFSACKAEAGQCNSEHLF